MQGSTFNKKYNPFIGNSNSNLSGVINKNKEDKYGKKFKIEEFEE